jgi:hypothetical protein
MGNSPDNQGNLYLTDPEGAAVAASSRIRKLLSGLNFPATTAPAPVTQTILVHFAPSDSPLTPTLRQQQHRLRRQRHPGLHRQVRQ